MLRSNDLALRQDALGRKNEQIETRIAMGINLKLFIFIKYVGKGWGHMSPCMWKGQRAASWSQFFPSTFTWI